jgi:hypothetical protein
VCAARNGRGTYDGTGKLVSKHAVQSCTDITKIAALRSWYLWIVAFHEFTAALSRRPTTSNML